MNNRPFRFKTSGFAMITDVRRLGLYRFDLTNLI